MSSVREVYDHIGGSYESVHARLMSEPLIERFVLRFREDASFAQLTEAMAAQDRQAAFMAAHTLKGVALTLSFDRLADAAARLTEALRAADAAVQAEAQLLQEVRQCYAAVMEAIAAYAGCAVGMTSDKCC